MADIQDSIEVLAEKSVETLKAYFEDTEPDKTDTVRARIAATVFSSVIRLRQTQGARDALGWNMASALLDKERLAEYVRASQPANSALVKALPAPAKDGKE